MVSLSGTMHLITGLFCMILLCTGIASSVDQPGTITIEQSSAGDTGMNSKETIIPEFDAYAEETFNRSGVPGMAVALVNHDKVVYMRCFGITNITTRQPVTPDTRFQLASISKSFASSVIASMVGDGEFTWDDRVSSIYPAIRFSDPWITEHLTFRDLLSHRTGLPEYAGDELWDLNFSRSDIISRLWLIPISGDFRSSYAYANIDITMAAEAAAWKAGTSWDDLIREKIFVPAGMMNTSSRFTDYMTAEDHADTYFMDDETRLTNMVVDTDPNSPAGGVSSTINDMVRYVRLQMNEGTIDRKQVIAADSVHETHKPQIIKEFNNGSLDAYGFGWEIFLDDGQYRVEHGGELSSGVSTFVCFYPGEKKAIIILTNGFPNGHILKKAMINGLDDLIRVGSVQKDWYGEIEKLVMEKMQPGASVVIPLAPLPPAPEDASLSWPLVTYTGLYTQDYYGLVRIEMNETGLNAYLGPNNSLVSLDPYDKNTFTIQGSGTEVNFIVDTSGTATSVHFAMLDKSWCNGTYVRISP